MDPLVIVAVVSSISALLVSVLTHVKHSSCGPCFDISTRTPTIDERKHLLLSHQPTNGTFNHQVTVVDQSEVDKKDKINEQKNEQRLRAHSSPPLMNVINNY